MTTKQVLVSHVACLFALLALAATIPLAGAVASGMASIARIESAPGASR